MVTLKELTVYCDNLLQINLFQDYSVNGLQVQGKPTIRKLASAVSASQKVIDAAVEWGADVLLVHHGIFWKDDNLVLVGTKAQKVGTLLGNGVSLVAYHLPLDAHQELGNNWRAALEMDWKELEPFYLHKGQYLGVKGQLPQPLHPKTFQQMLEDYYQHPAAAVLARADKPIQRVGLVSGGAYKCIADAAKEGLDAFVTGNFDEPAWHLAHEEGVDFFALGHAATEKIGPRALGEYLGKHFGLEHQFIDEENPF